jgi:hypothetical protein
LTHRLELLPPESFARICWTFNYYIWFPRIDHDDNDDDDDDQGGDEDGSLEHFKI